MDKLEKLDKYVITPNVKFYGGYIYDGKDIELCDDNDAQYDNEEKVYDINIKQYIEESILYTDINQEYIMKNGKK